MDETQKTGPMPFNDPVDVVPGTTSLADGWGWLADFRDAESAEEAQRRISAHPELVKTLKDICSEFAQQHPLIVAGRAAVTKAGG